MTIQLGANYDETLMDNENWEITLIPRDAENKRKQLKVVAYDKVAKTVTVKYGGAYSGEYNVMIESDLTSNWKGTKKLRVTSKVAYTDFNPKAGSKYGGQLITIDGGVFSDDPQKNPIKIGYEYTRGVVHYCDIVTTSITQVTCRMRLDYNRPAGEEELILFASTYEEAKCEASTCNLTFLDSD